MKLQNLIPLKEVSKKELDKSRENFRKNMGGDVWEDALNEIDTALGHIDDIADWDNRNAYDETQEYDDVSSNTYNYFLPHLAPEDIKPAKVQKSIDRLNKLYSKKLDDRYKELKKELDSAVKNLKNKIK